MHVYNIYFSACVKKKNRTKKIYAPSFTVQLRFEYLHSETIRVRFRRTIRVCWFVDTLFFFFFVVYILCLCDRDVPFISTHFVLETIFLSCLNNNNNNNNRMTRHSHNNNYNNIFILHNIYRYYLLV